MTIKDCWIRPRRMSGVLLAGALAVSMTACGGGTGSGTSGGSGAGGTLNLGQTQSAPVQFNPWGAGSGINVSLWLNGALYDSLTKLDANGQVVPSVATSWTVQDTKVSLQLRDDVKFDDGTPLDAAAVKANLDYAASNPNGAECNQYLEGAQTSVVSPTAVELTLLAPVPGILQDFAQCAGFMVNPKGLQNLDGLKSAPNGSGPYTLDMANTVIGQKYTLVRRSGYWDEKSYPFDKIVQTVYTSSTAAANAALSGQADFLQSVDPKDTSSGLKVIASAPAEYRGLYLTDVTGAVVPALADVRVRQAMNYAIDRAAIQQSLFGQFAEVAGSTPFNKNYLGYTPALANTYPYDVAKAKDLLAQAGVAPGLTIKALVDPGSQKLAEALAGYLRAVGINLDLSVHTTDFISQMLTGQWPLVSANYTLNPAQLQTLQGIAGKNGFWNPRKNSNPQFDALFDQIAASASAEEAAPLYAKLATTIAEQAWTVNPVLADTTMAYNDKKLKVTPITGLPVPFIYQFSPA